MWVALALWGAAAAAGALACSVEGPLRETPAGAEPTVPMSPAITNDEGMGDATENGQTGSLQPSQCSRDSECIPDIEGWAGGDAEFVLLDSGCEHGPSGFPPYRAGSPVCVCDVSVARSVRDRHTGEVSRGTFEELYFLADDERLKRVAGPQCLVWGADPGVCAYCDNEFPGCDVDASTNDCAAPCADAVERMRSEEQVRHEVELRLARCNAGRCEQVVRIDDDCYNQREVRSSCSLSDEQILAADGEQPNPGDQCALPPLPCDTAEACPAGLACNGSVCGACLGPDDGCVSGADGLCLDEAFLCGDGERCISGVCVVAERADCLASADCPTTDSEHDPRVCLLSSIDNVDGRGNELTRSFCSSVEPNPFGLRVGDVLEMRVLGPVDAVAAMFEPPIRLPRACDASTGLTLGATSRLRVETLSAPLYDPGAGSRAIVIDDQASTDPVPAPVHPRDPAQGRQLWNELSSPGNSAVVAFTAQEPTELEGCTGTRELWVHSLIARPERGEPPREEGTFLTSVVEYRFSVEDDRDPDCAAFPEFVCEQTVWVELKRLTP